MVFKCDGGLKSLRSHKAGPLRSRQAATTAAAAAYSASINEKATVLLRRCGHGAGIGSVSCSCGYLERVGDAKDCWNRVQGTDESGHREKKNQPTVGLCCTINNSIKPDVNPDKPQRLKPPPSQRLQAGAVFWPITCEASLETKARHRWLWCCSSNLT